MIFRVYYLIRYCGVKEEEIFITAFNRLARQNVEERLEELFRRRPGIRVHTIDKMAHDALKKY
jgi:superfamily I DNA/RNA helicase